MRSIPAVDPVQRVWKQDDLPLDQGGTGIPAEDRLPAATLYSSPYDLDASAGAKRSTHWIGDKGPFSETCDEDLPRRIRQVTTTIAPIPDRQALEDGARCFSAPGIARHPQHLGDAGYMDAEAFVTSQATYQVNLVGPTAKDYRGPGPGAEWIRLKQVLT
jgi:transposase